MFESYIKLKVVPLVKLVGPGIHGGYFDWGTESVPKGIRSYLKEILLYFVHVHAEVCSISSPHSVPLFAIHPIGVEIFSGQLSFQCH